MRVFAASALVLLLSASSGALGASSSMGMFEDGESGDTYLYSRNLFTGAASIAQKDTGSNARRGNSGDAWTRTSTRTPAGLPDEADPVVLKVPDPTERRSVTMANGDHVRRIAVYVTQEAIREAGNASTVQIDVMASIRELNTYILPNAGLGNIKFEVVIVRASNTREGSSAGETLLLFRNGHDKVTDSDLGALRIDHAVLISSLSGLGYSACGIGEMPGKRSVVSSLCSFTSLSLAHELLHNVGACHKDGPGGCSSYIDTDRNAVSIMGYRTGPNGEELVRVPLISTDQGVPALGGKPFGDARHNNVGVVAQALRS